MYLKVLTEFLSPSILIFGQHLLSKYASFLQKNNLCVDSTPLSLCRKNSYTVNYERKKKNIMKKSKNKRKRRSLVLSLCQHSQKIPLVLSMAVQGLVDCFSH